MRLPRLILCLMLFLWVCVPPSQLSAQSFSRADLDALEAEHIKAQMRLAELQAKNNAIPLAPREVEERLIRLAKDITHHDAQLQKLEEVLAEKRQAYDSALADYADQKSVHREALMRLILATRSPPPPLIASVKDVSKATLYMAVLDSIEPKIQAQLIDTQSEISELVAIQADISRTLEAERANKRLLNTEKAELEALISVKREQYSVRREELKRAQEAVIALATKAQTLRKLIQEIEANAPLPPSGRVLPSPKSAYSGPSGGFNNLKRPVAGPVQISFGQTDPSGLKSKGVHIRTRSSDIVIAPLEGVIVFAEDYLGFGKMIIIRISQDKYVVMHGMEKLFAEFGEKLQIGQPIGEMPEWRAGPKPLLYFETRDKNGPINPSKWLKG